MDRISIGQKSVDRCFPGLVSAGLGQILFSENDTTSTNRPDSAGLDSGGRGLGRMLSVQRVAAPVPAGDRRQAATAVQSVRTAGRHPHSQPCRRRRRSSSSSSAVLCCAAVQCCASQILLSIPCILHTAAGGPNEVYTYVWAQNNLAVDAP